MNGSTASIGACLDLPPDRMTGEAFPSRTGSRRTTLRVLVTGSRTWKIPHPVVGALNTMLAVAQAQNRIMVVVHGDCPAGADNIAKVWSIHNGAHDEDPSGVVEEAHAARWHMGRGAGCDRNEEMVACGADVCLAFIKDGSLGASHCARTACQAGIPVLEWSMTGNDMEVKGPVRSRWIS